MRKIVKKNHINNYWEYLETRSAPVNAKEIKIIDKKTFNSLFVNSRREKNSLNLRKVIKNLYEGHPYIVKNAISKNFIEKLKGKLVKISSSSKSSFYKMDFMCPNFWRRQSEKVAKKYSVKAVRDSYYFFRWNKENQLVGPNDPIGQPGLLTWLTFDGP